MRCLIIGCGRIGGRRARILRDLGVDLSLYDLDYARAHALADEVGGHVSTAPVDDLRTHDALLICTPPTPHLSWVLLAAHRGIPFFVEKPLDTYVSERTLGLIVENMAISGAWGLMGQTYRFVQSLRDTFGRRDHNALINAQILSGQHLKDWHNTAPEASPYADKEDGGIALTSLSHSLDTAQWLFGEIDALTGLVGDTQALGIPWRVEDTASLLLKMRSGAQVMIVNDFWKRPYQNAITATYVDAETTRVDWTLQAGEIENAYVEEMQHLIRCITLRYQGQPDILQGIKNLEWIDAARRASASGTWQRIENVWAKVSHRAF